MAYKHTGLGRLCLGVLFEGSAFYSLGGVFGFGEQAGEDPFILVLTALTCALIGYFLIRAGWRKLHAVSPSSDSQPPTAVNASVSNNLSFTGVAVPESDRGFAVFDLETNGLNPWDGMLEYAVVLLDKNLNVEGEYTSLIHQDSVHATAIHGIRLSDVQGAPTAGEAIPELMRLFSGRYLVGHNVKFDRSFVEYHLSTGAGDTSNKFAALKRPTGAVDIDTQWIAKDLVGVRKLTEATATLRWEHDSHAALGDARVTAKLLQLEATQAPDRFKNRLAKAKPWPDNSSVRKTIREKARRA